MPYINIREVACKYSQGLMLVSGPQAGCLVMASSGKVVAMRCKPYIPHREDVTLVAHETCPCLKAPQPYCNKNRKIGKNYKLVTIQFSVI
jgi:hypothetical protein